MVVDCHAHLDEGVLDVPSALRKMDAAGVTKVGLIPAMNGALPEESGMTDILLSIMRRLMNGPARPLAELVHRGTMVDGGVRIGKDFVEIFQMPDNDKVARVVEAHPERFFGWIFLNPAADAKVLDTLERYRAIPGMLGVKLHPHWHDYRTEILRPLLRRCEELDLPILIHLGFRKRGDFRSICSEFPKLRVISAHAGFPFYRDLWRYASECPNLHVDLSSPYIDEPLARRTVDAMGPERCLYGTDAPYGFHEPDGSSDYQEILQWIARMPLRSGEVDAVLAENAQRILGV